MERARASAEQRLERIAAAQSLLADTSRQLGPAVDLDATVKTVLLAMRELVAFRGGSICLVEHDGIRVAASDPPVSPEVQALRLPVGSGLVGRAVEGGRTVSSPDLDADDRVDPEIRRLGSNAGMVSYLAVPLVCLGRTIGVLQVDSPQRDAFDEVDVVLLEGLAAQAASAIESARFIEEMVRLDDLKHRFINMVSHELRTPLTIAAGMLHVYRQRVGADPEMDDLLDRSEAAMQRLRRLIEELILMSQLAAGTVLATRDPVAVRPLLEEVARSTSDPDGVQICCDEDLVWRSDRELLAHVVEALVDNALTYAGDAELVAGPTGFEVRDHGPGLPDDVLPAAGATFERSKRNDTTVAGLGLGLSLVQALVAELGGEVVVESSSAGTVVGVRLPG
ncbi:MAG TPA: GAF domain-containing sensor histidine kinase [Acidimicrobiales bacterium]|nr:GAF domain-containing sensor histidine kinase [Acidimicrobiales bacterium]